MPRISVNEILYYYFSQFILLLFRMVPGQKRVNETVFVISCLCSHMQVMKSC